MARQVSEAPLPAKARAFRRRRIQRCKRESPLTQAMQAVVPQMKKQKSGSIGCMSSVSAQRGGGILGDPHY